MQYTKLSETIDNTHPYGYETNHMSAYVSTEGQWSYPSFASGKSVFLLYESENL